MTCVCGTGEKLVPLGQKHAGGYDYTLLECADCKRLWILTECRNAGLRPMLSPVSPEREAEVLAQGWREICLH